MNKNRPQRGDLPVTVVLPVKNEETNLARCLERLNRFAEVVVIDSASNDATPAIAEKFGARVVHFVWNGQYPKKRNWFLINTPPDQPWVLFLDADEFIDDAFCDALAMAINYTPHTAFWINYTNIFLGGELNHGLMQRKLALFRVGAGLYEKIDEQGWSKLDMEVHEHPIIHGSIGEISAKIEHRDFKGLSKFIEKHLDYALWEAKRFVKLDQTPQARARFTGRQKFKYMNLDKWWYPVFYWAYTYVVKAGFLDGAPGFHYAFYKAWYFHTIRLIILESRGNYTDNS